MFSIYKTHHKSLYNKLVELSRNIFFYEKIGLKDNFETRINLIFVHLSLILIVFKESDRKKFPQDIFDNIFLNIEYHIRELGYGDVAVNKKMKELLRFFYDILLKIRLPNDQKKIINKVIVKNYFDPQHGQRDQLTNELTNYFVEYYNFCFELKRDSMLKGQINFKYK